MAAVHGAVLRRIHDLQGRNELASGERLNLEPLFRELSDAPAQILDRAEDGVETLRPACRQAPADRWLALRTRGACDSAGEKTADCRVLKKLRRFMRLSPWRECRSRQH